MDTEQTVDEIIELVYHSAAVSDDGWVQERCTRAAIWDLLERYRDSESKIELGLDYDLRQAEKEIEELKIEIGELETDNEKLHQRLLSSLSVEVA